MGDKHTAFSLTQYSPSYTSYQSFSKMNFKPGNDDKRMRQKFK